MSEARTFWDSYMRKHPHAEGSKVCAAYVAHLVQIGELLPVSNDGKRVFVDGIADCAIDFEHRLDAEQTPKEPAPIVGDQVPTTSV